MTDKQLSVEEGNKIIAEFMGGVFGEVINSPFADYNAFYFEQGNNPNPHANIGTYKRLNDLEYHLRWDWLMPVVEKIEGMFYDFSIVNSHVIVVNSENGYEYDDMANSKIKAVFQAVIEFIQWYNKQKL